MTNRRNNWYNQHSTRRYPLDDKATGTADDGVRLRDDVITDLHLRFPESAGRWVFLGGLTITNHLVTAIFLATDDPTQTEGFVPLAAVTVRRPVAPDIHIPVRGLVSGVGGYIVFGDTTEEFIGRFSTPQQGLVAARAARAYTELPIPSLRKLNNAAALTGLVTLRGQQDVEVVKDTVNILGHGVKDAFVVRLVQAPIGDNVLAKYIGPCDARPESRNCLKDPIETINGATPDCDGNIDILFCNLKNAPYESCGPGVTLDTSVGMGVVCAPQQPDRFLGRDLCAPSQSSSSSVSSFAPPPPQSSSSSSISISSGSAVCADLPYCQSFDSGAAESFVEQIGEWMIEEDVDSPEESCPGFSSFFSSISSSLSSSSRSSYSCSSQSSCARLVEYVQPTVISQPYSEPIARSYTCFADYQRNVSVWDNCGLTTTLDKRVITDLRLSAGARQNGGIVINHQTVDLLTNPHLEYFHALLDRREHAVRLMQYTGVSPIVEIARASLGSPAVIGHWYRMTIETQLVSGSTINIKTTVSGVTDPAWPTVTLNVPTNDFLPATGLFGLGSIRARCAFSFFSVEERT